MTESASQPTRPRPVLRRVPMLGIAQALGVTLVVLGQYFALRPATDVTGIKPFSGFLLSANVGYTLLLVAAGFAVTRAALDAGERGGLRALVAVVLRHFAVVLLACLLAVAAVLLITWWDSSVGYPTQVTQDSIAHVLGFNWNGYIVTHPLGVRGDLAGLWIFSVYAQVLVLILAVLAVLRTRPAALAVLLGIAVVGWGAWQWVVVDAGSWFEASLRTDVRGGAMLVGALGAVLAVILERRDATATADEYVGAAALVLIGPIFAQAYWSPETYFKGTQLLTALLVMVVLTGSALARKQGRIFDLEKQQVLRDVGRTWVPALAFVSLISTTVARHATEWNAASAVLICLGVLAGAVYAFDRVLLPLLHEARRALQDHNRATRGSAEVGDEDRGARSEQSTDS